MDRSKEHGVPTDPGAPGRRLPNTGLETRGWCDDRTGGGAMSESIYRVTEVIGTSPTSWEEAAKNAVEAASQTLRDLRVGEIVRLDVTIEDGKVSSYRARVNISFKYEHD
jgi:flavin-binding protein dodecin